MEDFVSLCGCFVIIPTKKMAEHAKPPEEMNFKTDIATNWKLWKQKFNLYLRASGKTSKQDDVKIAILLNLLGDEGLHIFNTFEYKDGESENCLKTVLQKFDEHCDPIKSAVYEHFKFFKRDQMVGETIDQFVTALKQLSATCEFKDLKETLIRDRIVLGVRDLRIQEKLLQHADLKLSEAVQICRAMESSVSTQEKISREQTATVGLVRAGSSQQQRGAHGSERSGGNGKSRAEFAYRREPMAERRAGPSSGLTEGTDRTRGNACICCGYSHERGKCVASKRYCSRCKQRGHYRKFCTQRYVHDIDYLDGHEDCLEHSDDSDDQSGDSGSNPDRVVWTVSETLERFDANVKRVDSINRDTDWFENIDFFTRNVVLSLKIDSGSQANLLSYADFKKLHIPKRALINSFAKLESYSGHNIGYLGKVRVNCAYGPSRSELDFYVLQKSSNKPSLLSYKASKALGIIKNDTLSDQNNFKVTAITSDKSLTEAIISKHAKLFNGHGRVEKMYKITLKENAVPRVSASRKIPLAIKTKVKQKLDEMVNEGIIVPVTEPTDWVHPIVVVPKPNGDIRVCMDPRSLNQYIKRELYPIPTLDCLFNELSGAKFFTLLDASQAFLQIPLEEDSSKLCTIATCWGRYRYLRLPYGISSAPEIFQRFISETLEGISGVIAYFDDVLVFGKTIEEHNLNLDNVLTKIEQSGLTLNLQKSKICQSSVKFLGHVISSSGVSTDSVKIQAIQNMTAPRNVKELQRFLGMVTYLAKFIHNLSQETALLRRLLSKNIEWVWSEQEEQCFNRLKSLVTSTPVLSFFDNEKPTTLFVDASPYGLGAVVMQNDHPVEYASVSLTDTQQRYNHIEKELLALVFGCERFHHYLFGRKFIIKTDHRPLLGLLKKPLDDLSPRIQRLTVRLLRYNFELSYVPGKQQVVADALSRDPASEKIPTDYLNERLRVHSVVVTSRENEQRLINAIDKDSDLQKLKYYALNGWPCHKSSVPPETRKYWSIRNDIYVHNNVLFYGKRLMIPVSLQSEILSLMHKAHQGVVSCKKIAQEAFYWPGIMKDIETLILSCDICQQYSRSNQREPLCPHSIPGLPWEKVGIDFKSFGTTDFLVIVDYYSKFVVVNKLHNKTASNVIAALKNVFSSHGLPVEIFSDNGPPFNSFEFSNFLKQYAIENTTSSPLYPKSNGMVERAIQTVKGLLTKAVKSGEDPFLAMLYYNVTPKADLPAPCDLLMGRKLRTLCPVPKHVLQPKFPLTNIKKKLEQRQKKQCAYYDKSSKRLSELKPEQKVLLQEKPRIWKPATVLSKSGPNDYIVKSADNAKYRRNRVFLKPVVQTEMHSSRDVREEQGETRYKLEEKYRTSEVPDCKKSVPPKDQIDIHVRESDVPKIAPTSALVTRSGRVVKRPCKLNL